MKCLHAMYELEESFAKATMCGSFRRATPFIEYLHNYTEEKDQMFFFYLCHLVFTQVVKFKQN